MNVLINDEAVYRTAPATPGLLKIYICFYGFGAIICTLQAVSGQQTITKGSILHLTINNLNLFRNLIEKVQRKIKIIAIVVFNHLSSQLGLL